MHKVSEELVEEERVALRVMIFKSFCEEDEWKAARRRPEKIAAKVCGSEVEMRTYGWKEQESDEGISIVGYVKVKPESVAELVKLSGRKGVFLDKLSRDVEVRSQVSWVKREKEEKDRAYFARALLKAEEQQVPLTYRRGGGSSLGLKGVEGAKSEYSSWVLKGAPQWWGPDALKQWLEKQAWAIKGESSDMSPPKTRQQGWIFGGKPPAGFDEEALQIYVVGAHEISVRKWRKGKPNVEETRIGKGRSAWMKGAKEEEGTADAEMTDDREIGEKSKEICETSSPQPHKKIRDENGDAIGKVPNKEQKPQA